METIKFDEWQKALGDAVAPTDPDALSIRELADQFGISVSAVSRRMKDLMKAGRAVRAFKNVATTDGFTKRVPAYKLVQVAPVAKKRRGR